VKLFHQPIEGARLFDRVQILALNVFHERKLECLLIAYFSQDHRNSQKLCVLRSAPPAFSCDQLVSGADPSYDERLNDAT
jgi:hypothetical protein